MLNPLGSEVRRLEEHGGRLLGDLAVLAAHDPGDRNRPFGIGDHEILGRQDSNRPVEERPDLLVGLRAPNDDAPSASLDWSNAWSRLPSASIA